MTPKEYEIMLSEAEVQLSRLKHLYEQWFQGIERTEPLIPRKQLDRTMHVLRKEKPRNTALRFRFQTLIQRYTTMQTYWKRVGRQIEEGTYRRDLLRARRRREAARAERADERRRRSSGPVELDPNANVDVDQLIEQATESVDQLLAAPKPGAAGKGLDLDESNLSVRPGAPNSGASSSNGSSDMPSATFGKPRSRRPVQKRRERSSPAISPTRKNPPAINPRVKGPGDARMRQIYDSYVDAKRKNNERTDRIDYETVAKSLKKMVPKLDRKHKGKAIDFKVVVKDGKVGIKPVVKK
jgi:hypothetical protein